METLYRWRVKDKDKSGKLRWRLLRAPMTEETARFWASNNHVELERIDWPGALKYTLQPDLPAVASAKTVS
jgi:hypothetical protein